jgi:two-component system, NtrC family, sensor histidine kinase KinB
MKNLPIVLIVFYVLIALMGVTLALNIPQATAFSTYSGPLFLYALLTVFALYFSASLSQGYLSAAHAIGVVAALSLPADAQPSMTWAIAIGGLIGGGVHVYLRERALYDQNKWMMVRAALLIAVRVALSFFVASYFYTAIGGTLPMDVTNLGEVIPVILFCIAYTLIYFALYLAESYGKGYRLRRVLLTSLIEILIVLALPLPLAVLGAQVYTTLSLFAFAICMIGLALAIIAPYVISRVQQRLRKQVDELRSLSIMGQAIGANHELQSLLNMVYVQVSNLLDTDEFQVALYRQNDKMIEYPLVIHNGQQVELPPSSVLPHSPLAYVLNSQTALLFSQEAHKDAWSRGMVIPEEIHSWLGVPLISGTSLFGAIVVISTTPTRFFTHDDLRLLNIVAASTSVALENVKLYEQQAGRARQLVSLNDTVVLLNQKLAPDLVLDTITQKARELSGASGVMVMLAGEIPSQPYVLIRHDGLSETFTNRPPQPLSLTPAHPIGLPLAIRDLERDDRALPLRDMLMWEEKTAWIELPLMVGDVRIGVMSLFYKRPQSFNDEEVELLRAFASQAALSVRNARDYAKADEALSRRVGQLLALANISHELTATLDKKAICSMVLEFAINATYTHIGSIILKDEVGDPEIVAHFGYPLELISRTRLMGQRVTSDALMGGEPYMVADITREVDYRTVLPNSRSQLAVPIVRRGDMMGVLTLESEQASAFNEEDIQFVTQLADTAVIAIDNTELFQGITEARDRQRLILYNMREPLILIDQNRTIALANPRIDMLGLDHAELLGQDVMALLTHPTMKLAMKLGFESVDLVRALLKGLGMPARRQMYAPFSYTIDRDGETLHVQRNVIPVQGEEGSAIGLLLVFYDQTEARALAQAREDLARMIIHDLRSPLTAVTTSLKLMNEIIPSESEFKSVVETTSSTGRRAIKKLLTRVDSLLDVAKMESGQLAIEVRPTELPLLIESARIELMPLATEVGAQIISEVTINFPPLAIDADKVERVLLNLIDNALKFTPEGKDVTLKAKLIRHSSGSNFAQIEVCDRGPGVPEDYKTSLFDRFVQVNGRSGRRRGTGLGLTFCRLVVEAHGGNIWVMDNPGGGSIFAFTLPLA